MPNLYLLGIVIVCFACSSGSEKSTATTSGQVLTQREANINQGKELYTTCKTCHGDQGEGNEKRSAPALANSDPWYLINQLKNFRKGIRGYLPQDSAGVQMAAYAKALADTTAMADVVAYIGTLPEVMVTSNWKGDQNKGQRIYETVCGSCHGPGAKGNELMHAPRLNGLQPWYLYQQIRNFKSGVRGAHADDMYGTQMVPMMDLLRDEQAIDDVIKYIQSTVHNVSQ